MSRGNRPGGRRITGSLSGVIAAAFFAAVVVVALEIVAFNHNVRFDLTVQKKYSLPERTVQLLKRLDQDVRFTVFYKGGKRKHYEEMFRLLALCTPHIHYRLVHMDQNPAEAKLNGVSAYGQSVVEFDGKRSILTATEESDVTRFILSIVSRGRRTVYFSSGHGEVDLEKNCKSLLATLKSEDWLVGNVPPSGSMPPVEGYGLLVVAGPQQDFSPGELDAIGEYLGKGGKIVWMLEPFTELPNIEQRLTGLDLILRNDIIIDEQNKLQGGGALTPIIPYLSDGPITGSLRDTLVFPSARSVGLRDPLETAKDASYLAMSSPVSWTKDDREAVTKGDLAFVDNHGRQGPIPVAAMVDLRPATAAGEAGAVVFIGDADFISDPFFDMQGNKRLFVNTLRWLGGEKDLMGLKTEQADFPFRHMTEAQGRWALYIAVLMLPGFCLLVGIMVVLYRRWRS